MGLPSADSGRGVKSHLYPSLAPTAPSSASAHPPGAPSRPSSRRSDAAAFEDSPFAECLLRPPEATYLSFPRTPDALPWVSQPGPAPWAQGGLGPRPRGAGRPGGRTCCTAVPQGSRHVVAVHAARQRGWSPGARTARGAMSGPACGVSRRDARLHQRSPRRAARPGRHGPEGDRGRQGQGRGQGRTPPSLRSRRGPRRLPSSDLRALALPPSDSDPGLALCSPILLLAFSGEARLTLADSLRVTFKGSDVLFIPLHLAAATRSGICEILQCCIDK